MSTGSGEGQGLRLVTSIDGAPPLVRPLRRFPAEPLVGRRSELARAIGLLTGSTRLLTVIGPGGVGKLCFAREMARQLHEEFDHDVVDVSLEPVRDPALVAVAIARAAGIHPSGDRDPIEVVVECFGERRVLLVLDNLEQVIDVAPRLGDLMGMCPSLHIIATSRLALWIGGEIELAAGRLRLLSPAGLAELLPQRLDVLRNDRRDALPHQRALRSTIEWSYRLLDAEQQAALRALGVFAGGFTVEAVAAVIGADTVDVLDHLDPLVRHHLVRVDIGPSGMGSFAPEVYRVPWSYPFRDPDGMTGEQAAARAITVIEKQVGAENLAAVIIEPIPGEGGFIVPAPGFLTALGAWCRARDVLLIADEIQSGLCRTGRWFASDWDDLEPDLVITTKALAAGMASAAVTGRAELVVGLLWWQLIGLT